MFHFANAAVTMLVKIIKYAIGKVFNSIIYTFFLLEPVNAKLKLSVVVQYMKYFVFF